MLRSGTNRPRMVQLQKWNLWGQGDSTLRHGSQGHGVMAALMSRRCHCLSSSAKNNKMCLDTFGAYVLQTLPNHRTATLRLFDATVAKLWQTTVLPASPGWFHVNRGEYPIVNSHKICETKTKTTHSRNLSSFLHMFDFQRMIDGKATGGCLQLHSIPLDLSLLWQDPPPKKKLSGKTSELGKE